MASRSNRPISPANLSRRWALITPSLIALFAFGRAPAAKAAKSGLQTSRPKIADFDRIWVNVPADIKIEPAEIPTIVLSAEQKVLDAIQITSSNGQLRVEVNGSFQTQKPVNITIGARRLSELDFSGSCDVLVSGPYDPAFGLKARDASSVSLNNLNLTRLNTDLSGSSELQATGAVTELSLNATDASSFDGTGLTAESARVEASGASEANLEVTSILVVKIKDAASVYYAGEPTIEQSVSFAGTLEPQ